MLNLVTALSALLMPLRDRLRSDDGLEAVEYALIAALIAVAVVTAVTALGNQVELVFTNITTTLTNALTAAN